MILDILFFGREINKDEFERKIRENPANDHLIVREEEPQLKMPQETKKGDITQKGETRYFTDKNDFFKTQKFVYDCKELLLKNTFNLEWSYESEKRDKELSEKHIGKNNPKEEYIKYNNELKAMIKNVCKASDFVLEKEKGFSLKELKENYNIKNFTTSKYEENANKVYNFVAERQSIYKDRVRNEINTHNVVNEDVYFLQQEDYIFQPVQERIITDYEEKTKTRNKSKVIEFLKEKLVSMFKRIQKLIDIQDLLYIKPKKQIEITKDKRNGNIYIENSSYAKDEQTKDDYELEL